MIWHPQGIIGVFRNSCPFERTERVGNGVGRGRGRCPVQISRFRSEARHGQAFKKEFRGLPSEGRAGPKLLPHGRGPSRRHRKKLPGKESDFLLQVRSRRPEGFEVLNPGTPVPGFFQRRRNPSQMSSANGEAPSYGFSTEGLASLPENIFPRMLRLRRFPASPFLLVFDRPFDG